MKWSRVGFCLLIVWTSQVLTGCTFTPDRSALVPKTYKIKERHQGTVMLQVTGGEEASHQVGGSDLWTLSDQTFAGALEDAINASGLFTRVVRGNEADFRIQVVLQRLFLPPGGGEMESQLSALWVLRTGKPDQVLWQDFIVTTGLTPAFETLSGVTRITRSMERAANKNILRAIHEMSLESLPARESFTQTGAVSMKTAARSGDGRAELTDGQRAVARQLIGTWQGSINLRTRQRDVNRRTLIVSSVRSEGDKLVALGDYGITGRESSPVTINLDEEEGALRLSFTTGKGSQIRLALRGKSLTGSFVRRSSEVRNIQLDRVE